MSTLLKEIQNGAISSEANISEVLRKCKILALKLKNKEFEVWVEHELNGYASIEQLPEYRVLKVESYGQFIGIGWSQIPKAPISASCLPKDYRNFVNTEYLLKPISYYYSLTKSADPKNNLQSAWPAEYISYFGDNIYEGYTCVNAWKLIPYNAIEALIETVRNGILSFAIEIEAEAPNLEEIKQDSKPIPDEKVTQILNTYIMGDVTSLSAGNQITLKDVNISVRQNDFTSLKDFLLSLGVGRKDVTSLEQAVEKDGKTYGKNVREWIDKIIAKSKKGMLKVAASVAAQLISQAIMRYLGISS